jgi:YVTN family beta-propeller protein
VNPRLLPLILLALAVGLAASGQAPRERVYVGETACRRCHHQPGGRDQFSAWRLTKHARAFAALSMPESRQIAELSGIAGDPTRSPVCLGCHTTAYDTEAWERDEAFRFEDGVQCERCHGPGSEYMDADVMRDSARARQAGLMRPGENDCLVCHKEKGSHTAVLNVRAFVFADALREIAHPGRGGPLDPEHEGDAVDPLPGPKYVGAFACGSCHGAQSGSRAFGTWRMSRHAAAYATLGTARAGEIAREMGVTGNPQQADRCLGCHATGGGEPAGRFMASFDAAQGVQCESCHGPGSEYMAQAVMLDPVAAADGGLLAVDRRVCTRCHTPGIHGRSLDIEATWPRIDHTAWKDVPRVEYKTPFNLAVTQDGRRLFVACEASNSLIVLDVASERVIAELTVGMQPHFALLSQDETRAYVSNRGSDDVSVVDVPSLRVVATIPVGDEPHEMATNEAGTLLYVANAGTYDVSVVELATGREVKRLAASRGPWGVARSPDGRHVYVTNNLPRFGAPRTPSASEVTVIGAHRAVVERRVTVPDANLVQGVAFAPSGEFALVTLIRTKSLVPMTRNLQGWVITNGIAVLWNDGRVDQLLLDEFNDAFADPTDIVFSRDGAYAFVTGGGVQEVAVIDVARLRQLLEAASREDRLEVLPNHLGTSAEFVVRRIGVGRSPRGMAMSPDGRYLYVADALDDAISVIEVATRERVRVLGLGGPQEITQARYGERIFHDARNTPARQFSCHSCHPDGHIDGITYDIEPDGLGVNAVDNRTLRGINDTGPFKWAGTNPTLQRQCGPRLAAFFTRADPFTAEQAAALDRYIVTIRRPPNRYRAGDELTPAQRRGKVLFERQYDRSGNLLAPTERCVFCHAPPYFTNRNKYDVGTRSPMDTYGVFDVPHLNNIYDSSPYLHDGRAHSLEEIWTLYNPQDRHGRTNDLMKAELNDLIEYLKTL